VKHTDNFKWKYTGLDNKGKPMFKRQINESLDDVTSFLDDKGIKYIIGKGQSLAIYSRIQKFRYYYTTGRWHKNAFNNSIKSDNTAHYMSKGIEDFYTRFLSKTLRDEDLIDYIRTVIGDDKSKARNFYLLYYSYKDEKFCPFINRQGISWIKNTDEYANFQRNKNKIQAYADTLLKMEVVA